MDGRAVGVAGGTCTEGMLTHESASLGGHFRTSLAFKKKVCQVYMILARHGRASGHRAKGGFKCCVRVGGSIKVRRDLWGGFGASAFALLSSHPRSDPPRLQPGPPASPPLPQPAAAAESHAALHAPAARAHADAHSALVVPPASSFPRHVEACSGSHGRARVRTAEATSPRRSSRSRRRAAARGRRRGVRHELTPAHRAAQLTQRGPSAHQRLPEATRGDEAGGAGDARAPGRGWRRATRQAGDAAQAARLGLPAQAQGCAGPLCHTRCRDLYSCQLCPPWLG